MSTSDTVKEIPLLKTEMILDQSVDQSHITFRIFVPEGIERLKVELAYDPPFEENSEQLQPFFQEHSDYYNFHIMNNPKVAEKVFPVNNLLTLSIDDPSGFRGSCHRFRPTNEIKVGENDSTPGINNGEIQSGMWDITINCHAIISESCHLKIQVKGVGKETIKKRWYHKPFEQPPFPLRKIKPTPRSIRRNDKWIKSEIHCHTDHSDGSQTVKQLIEKAEELGIECLAITDHNTMSAIEELQSLTLKTTPMIVKGIEWTTFYGHLLTLGYDNITRLNWGHAGPLTLEQHITEIKKEKAIVGIAHPFRPGSPFCTGCYWEYEMKDLEQIDFIEVWNGENPHRDKFNQKAFTLWTNLLNEGHQIAATTGRDWHHSTTSNLFASLYLKVPEQFTTNDVKEAIKSGRSYISLQPKINFTLNEEFVPGDQIKRSQLEKLHLNLDIDDADESYIVVIDSNVGELYKETCNRIDASMDSFEDLTYVRACVYSSASNDLIAFTNPIYLVDHNGEA